MKTYLLIAVAAASLMSAPAFAQTDSPFTGFRVEGHLGYDSVNIDIEEEDADIGFDEGGLLYGLGIGYDYDFGSVVAGIEANLDFSGVDASMSQGTDRLKVQIDRDIEVSARLGAKIGEQALLYAKAGYTNAKVSGTFTSGGVSETQSDTSGGWRVGAGLEYAFGGNAFGKIEYRYSDYKFDVSRNQVLAGFGFRF